MVILWSSFAINLASLTSLWAHLRLNEQTLQPPETYLQGFRMLYDVPASILVLMIAISLALSHRTQYMGEDCWFIPAMSITIALGGLYGNYLIVMTASATLAVFVLSVRLFGAKTTQALMISVTISTLHLGRELDILSYIIVALAVIPSLILLFRQLLNWVDLLQINIHKLPRPSGKRAEKERGS